MSGITARHAALKALNHVLKDHRMLVHFSYDPALSGMDRARAGRLAHMVLSNLGPVDAVLKGYLDRRPPWPARMVLRLAVAELMIAGADAHGVVDSAVQIMKLHRSTARLSGFVNAVLRRIVTQGPAIWAEQPPQRLPNWIAQPVRKSFGQDALRAIELAHTRRAPIDLTCKTANMPTLEHAIVLPTGSLRLDGAPQVSTLPGYADGAWWVQDAAAALPARLLGDVAGRDVLDLCAAPGGKMMQLAAQGAQVTALDISEPRMARVRENLGRTGLQANVIVGDAFDYDSPQDFILLDAPCSATGTIRRHPDLPFVKSGRDVEPLTKLQMRLIDHAFGLLRRGGRMVYCTCSLLPVEGEFQIKAALGRHSTMRIAPIDPIPLGGTLDCVCALIFGPIAAGWMGFTWQ